VHFTQDDNGNDDGDKWRRAAETSIISISSDSDDNSGDNHDTGLRPVAAPLLVARSRTAMSRKLANTAGVYREDINHEVIDLT